jgi:protein SCO1/2
VRRPDRLARITLAVGLGCVAAFAAGCGGSSGSSPATTAVLRPAALGALPAGIAGTAAPRIRLTDAATPTPTPFDTDSLRGRPYFVTFLYTSCTTTCPVIGAELHETLRQLGRQAARVAVVGVTVDPRGDTPHAVRAWLALHHEPPNFHYLIGSRAQLMAVWPKWYVLPQPGGAGGPSVHTATVWVIDARGRRVAQVPAGAAIDPAQLAAAARRLLS